MSWADNYIAKLLAGETVQFRPRGNSMVPLIHSGNLVTLVMATRGTVKVGDIVLCKVKGAQYLHLVKAIDGERYQIVNNRGGINGWTSGSHIYGRVTKVEE